LFVASRTRDFEGGVRLLQEGDPQAALAVFERLARTAPSDGQRADALYNVAICHLRLDSEPDALVAISDAVRADAALSDEIRSDPDFSSLAGSRWFERALTGVIRPAPPISPGSPLKREVTKIVWKRLVPSVLLCVAAGVAAASGLPTFISLGLVIFVLIAVPLSLHSLLYGDIRGAMADVTAAAALAGGFVIMIICVIAFALVLTALGL
jgi:hypothetical protein